MSEIRQLWVFWQTWAKITKFGRRTIGWSEFSRGQRHRGEKGQRERPRPVL